MTFGDAEVAVFGVPFDAGTTYRPGTRFGPQGIRRSTNLFGTYCYELGVDLRESLTIVDIGDVFTIPANIEKVVRPDLARPCRMSSPAACSRSSWAATTPSVTRPCAGWRRTWTATSGIIHFDRHVDTQETDLDERMHTSPWFHATNIPNAPAKNLVQLGIGGWQVPRPGVRVGPPARQHRPHDRGHQRDGIEKIAEIGARGRAGRTPRRST